MFHVTLRHIHVITNVFVEKQEVLNFTIVCLALVIQHANHIFFMSYYLLSVACVALPYFSTLSHK